MRIQFGNIVTAASGRAGAIVFATNSTGPFLRRHTSPKKQKTQPQSRARSRWSAAAKTWSRSTTADQQNAWHTYAKTLQFNDPFGTTNTITSFSAFMRTNYLRSFIGLPPIANPPSQPGHGPQTSICRSQWFIDQPNNNIAFSELSFPEWDKDTTNDALIIKVSKQTSQGTNYPTNNWIFQTSYIGNATTPPPTIITAYQGGILRPGNRIFLSVKRIAPSGAVSKSVIDSKDF